MADLTDSTIEEANNRGLQIVNRDQLGTQFRKEKQWQKGAVIAGLLMLPLGGFGILILVVAALDYAMAKDSICYISAAQLAQGKAPPDTNKKPSRTFWVVIGVLLAVLAVVIAVEMTRAR